MDRLRIAAYPSQSATLPRAHSSPSPPASKHASGRADPHRKHQPPGTRRRPGSLGTAALRPQLQQGWSTSYHAGSSSSDSDSTDGDDTDDELHVPRGRTPSPRDGGRHRAPNGAAARAQQAPPRTPSVHAAGERRGSPARPFERAPFTRSRSPAVHTPPPTNEFALPPRPGSPSLFSRGRHTAPVRGRALLPALMHVSFRIPCTTSVYTLAMDVRQTTENVLLVCSLGYCATTLRACTDDPLSPDSWASIEISLLIIASILYYSITRLSWSKRAPAQPAENAAPGRPGSSRGMESRESKRGGSLATSSLIQKDEAGFVWMTVPKNYRDSADDGILTGLLGGPFVATALLYLAIQNPAEDSNVLPPNWLVEAPVSLPNTGERLTAHQALLVSRRSLVSLSTLCATILIVHVCASRVTEARHRRRKSIPDGELSHVPRKEAKRAYLYVLFAISVTLWVLCVKILLVESHLGVWQNLSRFEVVAAAFFYQFSLYSAVRLAHHGFTLGELGIVCFGATVLFMEMMNLTFARIWPLATPFIKTYRLPTPLLIYQIALIPGSLLTGFILSPLLYLSRQVARRPVRRLRFPEEKQKQRRLIALAFYGGSFVMVVGVIGMWTRWSLRNRDPWLWVIFWLLEGKKKWTRPLLLAYWAVLGSISVAGWNRQLARSRRHRHRVTLSVMSDSTVVPYVSVDGSRPTTYANAAEVGDASAQPMPAPEPTMALSLNFSNLPNLPNLGNGSTVATDLLDAADKRVPTLSVNARRKFFHALAVFMFLPGIAIDPAFAHLAFNAAFALFTFAEYVRYFALYPFGAAVHLFMYEFLDQKDSGTAILSHFYLLTGCANSVWFEGNSRMLEFTGILVLGVGDALASIIGKRIGRHRWSAGNPKTIEGSAAFVVSVVLSAWALRMCGFTERFSIFRYAAVATLSSVLEAFSVQNDNLTLPLYMWSMLAVSI